MGFLSSARGKRLEAVGGNELIARGLCFRLFALNLHALLLKIEELVRKLPLLFAELVQALLVRSGGFRHLAFDLVEGVQYFFEFHLLFSNGFFKLPDPFKKLRGRLLLVGFRLPLILEELSGFCDESRRGRLRKAACIPQETFEVSDTFDFIQVFRPDFRDAGRAVRREAHYRDLKEASDGLDHPAAFLLLILSAAAHAEADGKAVDRSMLQGREHRVRLRVSGGKFALNAQALFILYG